VDKKEDLLSEADKLRAKALMPDKDITKDIEDLYHKINAERNCNTDYEY
jgi:hypothetical protein